MESRLVQKLPLTMGIKDWMDEWEGVYESSLVQVPNSEGGFCFSLDNDGLRALHDRFQ